MPEPTNLARARIIKHLEAAASDANADAERRIPSSIAHVAFATELLPAPGKSPTTYENRLLRWRRSTKREKAMMAKIAVAAMGMMMLAGSAQAAPITVGSYYEDNAFRLCANTTACAAAFSKVPGTQRILITNIACHIDIGDSQTLTTVRLGIPGAGRLEPLRVGPGRTNGTTTSYEAGGEVKFLYTPGQTPAVLIYASNLALIAATCRIVATRPAPV